MPSPSLSLSDSKSIGPPKLISWSPRAIMNGFRGFRFGEPSASSACRAATMRRTMRSSCETRPAALRRQFLTSFLIAAKLGTGAGAANPVCITAGASSPQKSFSSIATSEGWEALGLWGGEGRTAEVAKRSDRKSVSMCSGSLKPMIAEALRTSDSGSASPSSNLNWLGRASREPVRNRCTGGSGSGGGSGTSGVATGVLSAGVLSAGVPSAGVPFAGVPSTGVAKAELARDSFIISLISAFRACSRSHSTFLARISASFWCRSSRRRLADFKRRALFRSSSISLMSLSICSSTCLGFSTFLLSLFALDGRLRLINSTSGFITVNPADPGRGTFSTRTAWFTPSQASGVTYSCMCAVSIGPAQKISSRERHM
mmetsp:Transcript_5423/g.12418  ORF Transcript_5423/g.12418 Transcript_5423/m.12418 type:complete len:372 (+) Transcript_5423:798-1913(+)